MHQHYQEILEKFAPQEPLWFTEGGFPRWVPFHPSKVDNIYADQIVLARIRCQNCEREFHVAFSSDVMARKIDGEPSLWDVIENCQLHYGDPPNIKCCCAGPTMNSQMIRVLEAWERDFQKNPYLYRLHELEVGFE